MVRSASPLESDGKPAKTLKAILYAEGCQFSVLSVDLLSDPIRNETFERVPLSKITLRGIISTPPSATGALDVEIYYVAAWDHKFFHLADGLVQMFILGKAPLDAEGRFEIPIADFSKDRITNERNDAHLRLIVREHSTWNIVTWVMPPADLRNGSDGLKVLPWYGPEMLFERRSLVRPPVEGVHPKGTVLVSPDNRFRSDIGLPGSFGLNHGDCSLGGLRNRFQFVKTTSLVVVQQLTKPRQSLGSP